MVDHALPLPARAKRHQTLRRPRKALVQRLRRRTCDVKFAFFRRVDMDFPPSTEIIRPARLVAAQAWTVEQLQSCLAAEKPAAPIPLGRPAKPAPLKWLGAVSKAVGHGQGTAAWTADVALLPPAAQGKLGADLLALQAAIAVRLAAVP